MFIKWGMTMLCCLSLFGCAVTPLYNTAQFQARGFLVSSFKAPLVVNLHQPKNYYILGRTHGGSSIHSLLGLITFGDGSFSAAYRDALMNRNGADALVDIQTDQDVFSFLGIYTRVTLTVAGCAVKSVEGRNAP